MMLRFARFDGTDEWPHAADRCSDANAFIPSLDQQGAVSMKRNSAVRSFQEGRNLTTSSPDLRCRDNLPRLRTIAPINDSYL